MRIFHWILVLIIAVPAVMFALSNQGIAVIQVWPLPFEISIPTYLLVFTPFVLGFILGGFAAWWSGGKSRHRARDAAHKAHVSERRVGELETEVENLKSAAKDTDTAVPATVTSPNDRAAA